MTLGILVFKCPINIASLEMPTPRKSRMSNKCYSLVVSPSTRIGRWSRLSCFISLDAQQTQQLSANSAPTLALRLLSIKWRLSPLLITLTNVIILLSPHPPPLELDLTPSLALGRLLLYLDQRSANNTSRRPKRQILIPIYVMFYNENGHLSKPNFLSKRYALNPRFGIPLAERRRR